MAARGGRSFAASVIGWVAVALIAYFLFGFVIGTIRWILRLIVILVVIGALLTAYVRLRSGHE